MCQAGGTRRGTPPPPGPIPISAHAATVDVAHSRTPHTGGNRGIMRNSIVRSGHGRVPMCVDPPSLHMGARPPHTTPTRKACHSNKNQPPSCRDPGLPCATPTTTTPEARTHRTPHRDRSSSASRSVQFSPTNPTSKHARQARGRKPHATPREPSTNSTPAEARPISARVTTDLEPK